MANPSNADPKEPVVTTAALARHLGVSRWTVSRVLNGHDGVLPETVERVHKAMAELGFQPNALARSLRGGRSGAIGVCFQEIESPILARKVALLQQALRRLGYRALIELTSGDQELERQALVHFLSMQVEGMVLIGSQVAKDDPTLAMVQGQRVPIVWVDPEHKPLGDQISVNRVWSMRLVLDHLLGLGHRKIGVIGIDPQNPYGAFRMPALLTYAAKCGLSPERDLLMHYHAGHIDHDYPYGYTLARELLERCAGSSTDGGSGAGSVGNGERRLARPTALIALNDRVAIGAMAYLREVGIDVPGQMSVVGYDNLGVTPYLAPPLTSIDHHAELLMSRAAEILAERIGGRNGVAAVGSAGSHGSASGTGSTGYTGGGSAGSSAANGGGSAGSGIGGEQGEDFRQSVETRLRDEAGTQEVEVVTVGDSQHIRVRPSLIVRGSTARVS